ncbi:unnamed protein product [Orchesella dallaii]|uniref:Uncharacterized protein n=1 Tax=Orchesella dallaii TaxID=48710 RepID=A0ABP1RXF4_9HEXA
MNFKIQFLFLGIVLGILLVCVSFSKGEDELPLDLIDCKKIMARIAKRTLKAFGNCTKELRANVTGNRDEFEKKLGCAVRCTLFRLELLDDQGQITKDRIQKFMDEMVPQDAHEFGHALAADCNESYGAKLDMGQEYCESYSEYAQCMQGTLADFADKTHCHPGPHG